jgi:hypothetical protein
MLTDTGCAERKTRTESHFGAASTLTQRAVTAEQLLLTERGS